MEHLHCASEMKGSRVRALALNTYAGSMPSAHTHASLDLPCPLWLLRAKGR